MCLSGALFEPGSGMANHVAVSILSDTESLAMVTDLKDDRLGLHHEVLSGHLLNLQSRPLATRSSEELDT